jgi:hypothetical protein
MRLAVLLLACCAVHASAGVIVSVQSQSPEQMQALTEAVDAVGEHGTDRVVLGAIEATMSRVVDSDLSMGSISDGPVMARLADMRYDNSTHEWIVQYESMRHDPADLNNVFNRTLYLTRRGTLAVIGDTQNPLLQVLPVSTQEALLARDYIVAPGRGDALTFAGPGVTSSEEAIAGSLRSVVTIRIPHEVLVAEISTPGLQDSAEWGFARTWSFGIGMVFRGGGGHNMLMFDRFLLFERSADLFQVHAQTQYSLARHVEFYSLDAGDGIRVAFFHFTLGSSKRMNNVYATVNGQLQDAAACAALQARVSALPDSRCLVTYPLCELHLQQIGSVQTVSFAIPMQGESMRTDLMLNITDHATRQTLIASVNFNVGASSTVCQDAVVALHDPLRWVEVDLYRNTGAGLSQPAALSGRGQAGTLMTNLMLTIEAEIMSQALFALVLRPQASPEAAAYFASTNDQLNLDSVIMSHAHNQATPPPAPSRMQPVGPRNSRSRIEYSSEAENICPREAALLPVADCVTTEDWAWTGTLARPLGGQHFVHEMRAEALDRVFLSRVFGSDGVRDATAGIIDSFYQQSAALRVAHAKVYWLWPIYNWQRSPIGLADRTIVSLSWSLTPHLATRRLLAFPTTTETATWAHFQQRVPGPSLREISPHCVFCSNSTHAAPSVRRAVPLVRHLVRLPVAKKTPDTRPVVRRRTTTVAVPVRGNDY